MVQTNRRQALLSLSALALGGCGGGGGGDAQESGGARAASLEASKELFAAPPPGGTPAQFLLWDAGSGPSRDYWNVHLAMPWKNRNVGDWLDADGTPQGSRPWAAFTVKALGAVTVDVTALAARWVSTGENRGAFLRGGGVSLSAYALWAGRQSDTPPRLLVRTEQGEFSCAGLVASFNPSTYRNLDTRLAARHAERTPVMVQFDLGAVRGTVQQALMTLVCLERDTRYVFNVGVFEVDAPRFQLGGGGQAPRMGIAAGGDAALRAHPALLRMGDFSNLSRSGLFDELSFDSRNPYELLADPDAPGTVMFRGSMTPNANLSFNGVSQFQRGNADHPLRPALPAPYQEMYARLYIWLEEDWNSSVDINKLGVGWDLRMGWWNDYGGGYWYTITGNGGVRGSGRKMLWPAGSSGGVQLVDRWGYEGHSVRMYAGKDPGDDSPYRELRPLQDYIYSLDQADEFGDLERLGSAVLSKCRWHCLEQRIKVNSVDTSVTDALGNGEANPDGELDTWLDGVLVSQRRGLRWRRHPEMGLRGPWVNWYFGGRQRPTSTMHYRMNHFAVATEYIGPRVG